MSDNKVSILPDFRRIYQTFRTEEEERDISNSAFFKFCGFIASVVAFNIIRAKLSQ